MKMSLSKTLLCFMLASVLIFLASVTVIYGQYSRAAQSQQREYVSQTLQATTVRFVEEVGDIADDMNLLAAGQVIMNFDAMTAAQRYQIKDYIKTILDSFASFKKSVIGLKLHLPGRSGMYSASNFSPLSDASLLMAYRQIVQDYQLDYAPQGTVVTQAYSFDGNHVFGIAVPIYASKLIQNDDTYIGCLLSVCNYGQLSGVLPLDTTPCFITDGERLLLHNSSVLSDSLEEAMALGKNNLHNLLLSSEIPGTRLKAFALYSDKAAAQQVQALRNLCVSVTFLLLSVQCLLLFILRLKIIKPIEDIAQQTQQIGKGMMRVENPDASRNELDSLTHCINDMLLRVKQLSCEAANAENKYLKERVMFLQTQINPHFLFNNLECIRGMASMDKRDSIIRIVASMAKIYRYCVDSRNHVSLSEELDCLKEYMQIMTLRYDGAFMLHIDAQAQALEMMMPKMVLQPLAENAIQHGFLHARRRHGTLKVEASVQDGMLVVSLSDDGVGMTEEMMQNYNAHQIAVDPLNRRHIGIANIQGRIDVICDAQSGMHFSPRAGGGLRVTLRLREIPISRGMPNVSGGGPR